MFGWFKRKKKAKPLSENKTDESLLLTQDTGQDASEKLLTVQEAQKQLPDFVQVRNIDDSEDVGIVINADAFPEVNQDDLSALLSKKSGFSLFEGEIKYGYDLRQTKSKEICPKCMSHLSQYFSNILYTDGIGIRINSSGFGYFCNACPTVVIDVALLSKNLSKGIKFRAIAGLGTTKHGTMMFKEWNGEKTIYVMDEDENLVDVISMGEAKENPLFMGDSYYRSWDDSFPYEEEWKADPRVKKQKKKNRKRNKSAKKSRRKNRK